MDLNKTNEKNDQIFYFFSISSLEKEQLKQITDIPTITFRLMITVCKLLNIHKQYVHYRAGQHHLQMILFSDIYIIKIFITIYTKL